MRPVFTPFHRLFSDIPGRTPGRQSVHGVVARRRAHRARQQKGHAIRRRRAEIQDCERAPL